MGRKACCHGNGDATKVKRQKEGLAVAASSDRDGPDSSTQCILRSSGIMKRIRRNMGGLIIFQINNHALKRVPLIIVGDVA